MITIRTVFTDLKLQFAKSRKAQKFIFQIKNVFFLKNENDHRLPTKNRDKFT